MSEQEKKQSSVAEVLVKCLENEGVKYVFGIPGEENLDMMNALEKSDIRVVVVRHEQGAAFMADMYGRLTGKAGVCFSTLGPGATNLITGTADANSDGASDCHYRTGGNGADAPDLSSVFGFGRTFCSDYQEKQTDRQSQFRE